MTVGNVISLTPPHPGLPGQFDWRRAKMPVSAQDSSSTDSDSDDPEPGRESSKARCSRPCSRSETTSGTSLWKPVVLIIASLNIVALGGLVYSAPWKPKAEQDQTSVPMMRQQAQRKLLIPLEASVTADGTVSTRYPRGFLASVPAAVKRSLLDSLRGDAFNEARRATEASGHPRQGAGSLVMRNSNASMASRGSNVTRESIE
mmetsp:Transcript_66706/g.186153  ORF Transcript_66706/g.186153 Transcript_66706/m.186153 type:complete len:203 (-) Transcript_66706:125-733(-)